MVSVSLLLPADATTSAVPEVKADLFAVGSLHSLSKQGLCKRFVSPKSGMGKRIKIFVFTLKKTL